jgi:hypothetical protein
MNDQVFDVRPKTDWNRLNDLSAYDFKTTVEPFFTKDGNAVPSKFGRAVVRHSKSPHTGMYLSNGDKTVIGRIGPRTHHKPLIENQLKAADLIEASGIDITDCKITDNVFDNGARARRQIELPRYLIEPRVGDITRFMLDIYDSQNNSWAFQIKFSAMRLWCLNGCTTPDFQIRVYNKHGSAPTNMEHGVKAIARAIHDFGQREDEFRKLMNLETRPDDAEEIYKKTIAYSRKKEPWQDHFSKPKLQDLVDDYNIEASYAGHNAYSIYNGATRWATHFETKGSEANAIVNRQTAVAGMLKSKVWKDLVDA